MPLSPTLYMALVRPTPDDDDDVWDDILNDAFGLVDGHRHIPGEGRPIPSDGIELDEGLDLNSGDILNVNDLYFINQLSAPSTGARKLFALNGSLYYRNGAGQNVRITNGSTLDVTAAGGIGGDYGTSGAEFAYSDSSDTYTAKQEVNTGVRMWAKLASADLALYPYYAAGHTPAVTDSVKLQAPTTLASPYTLTLMDDLPADDSLLQVTTAGVVTASNTVPEAVTFSSAVTAGGLITANAGLTAGANQDITVSGTGAFNHGNVVLILPAGAGQPDGASTQAFSVSANATAWKAGAVSDIVAFAIPLKDGDRIKEVRGRIRDTAGANTITMKLMESSPDVVSQVGATQTSTGTGAVQTLALTGLTSFVATNNYFHVEFQNATGTTTTNAIYSVEVTYDHP